MSDRPIAPVTEDTILTGHVAPPQPPLAGDFIYRVLQPDKALGTVDGFGAISLMNLSTERNLVARQADLLIIQMLGDPDLLPIIEYRRSRGLKTIIEISDNFFDFQTSNPARSFYENVENQVLFLQLLKRCDAAQFTCDELARRFGGVAKEFAVFPNNVERITPLAEKRTSPLTIGWAGSLGHIDDMRMIAPALSAWLAARDDVRLAIMGPKQVLELFNDVPDARKRYVEPAMLNEYLDFLDTLNVGLAPLNEDAFNLCRSDLKFIEYASRGAAPVCSRIATYAGTVRDGETGFLFGGPEEMVEILERLRTEPELVRRVAAAAHAEVAAERIERAAVTRRAEFYRRIARKPSGQAVNLWGRITTMPDSVTAPDSRHCLMNFSHAERLMYVGMQLQFAQRNPVEAAKHFYYAAGLAREYYLAHLYAANAYRTFAPDKAKDELKMALKFEPDSVAATMLMADLVSGTPNEGHRATPYYRMCVEKFPYSAWSRLRLAATLKYEKRMEEYKAALSEAIESEPLNFLAVSRLITHLYQEKCPLEAEKITKRFIDVYRELPAALAAIGSSLMESGAPLPAAEIFIERIEADPHAKVLLPELLKACAELQQQGDFKAALGFLDRLSRLYPDNTEIVYRIGGLHKKTGDMEAARAVWEKLSALPGAERYAPIIKAELEREGG